MRACGSIVTTIPPVRMRETVCRCPCARMTVPSREQAGTRPKKHGGKLYQRSRRRLSPFSLVPFAFYSGPVPYTSCRIRSYMTRWPRCATGQRRPNCSGAWRCASACCLRPRRRGTCQPSTRPSIRRSDRRPGARITRDVVVVPVLRAGLGMLDAVLELIPTARVGHIGLQRDELTAVASQYYSRATDGSQPELRAHDRSDAGNRRQRRRGTRSAAGGRARATSA